MARGSQQEMKAVLGLAVGIVLLGWLIDVLAPFSAFIAIAFITSLISLCVSVIVRMFRG